MRRRSAWISAAAALVVCTTPLAPVGAAPPDPAPRPPLSHVLAVDPSVADGHSGHGIVMPQCHHGGPGRAGNGEELGGLNGLRLYHQRVAVQGSAALIAAVSANAISFA